MTKPFKSTFCWLLFSLGLMGVGVAAGEPLPNLENGRKIYATCAACHEPGVPSNPGPDLRGVFGRKIGTVPGFRYSRAMKTSRIVWDETTLNTYLVEPQELLPGNAMPFPGLPRPEDRRDLLAYLKTSNPKSP